MSDKIKPFLATKEEVQSTLFCEVCGATVSNTYWPKGWWQCGRSVTRILLDNSVIACWCSVHADVRNTVANPSEEDVAAIRKQLVDAEFAHMAKDADYQKESQFLAGHLHENRTDAFKWAEDRMYAPRFERPGFDTTVFVYTGASVYDVFGTVTVSIGREPLGDCLGDR